MDKQKGKCMRVRENIIIAEKGENKSSYVVEKGIKRKI
jgi:hypothetical protein